MKQLRGLTAALILAAAIPCRLLAAPLLESPPPEEPGSAGEQTPGEGKPKAYDQTGRNPPAGGEEQPPEGEEETGEAPGEVADEMEKEDVKVNFPTVVEAFVSGHSPDGYWQLPEKGSKRVWKLKLLGVDAQTLKKTRDNLYAARARLQDVDDGKRLNIEFTVNFSGAKWRVEKIRLLNKNAKPPAKRRKPKKPAKTQAPEPEQAPAP